jgi:Iap family predicted aminopeptidase
MRLAATSALLMAVLAGCGGSSPGPAPPHPGSFDAARAFRDLRSEVAIGPRPAGSPAGRRDARFIARRLRAAGVDGVRIQRPYLNVVGHIPGSVGGTVVVGAHHDTKDIPRFVGANDGASGVAIVLELARQLAPRTAGPAVDFALFDAEESPGPGNGVRAFERAGDRGSAQYVRYAANGAQGTPPLGSIRAMVLFDLVGDCDLQIPHEASSDPRLYGLFADAAAQAGGTSPFGGESGGVLDDHTPFERAGVPSVDLIDFSYGPGPPPGAWFHTTDDNLSHVCRRSLGDVGGAAADVIPRIR